MGKGDKRSFRGKITMGTYGKKRPRKILQPVAAKPKKATPTPKAKEEKEEVTLPKATKTVKKKAAAKKTTEKTTAKTAEKTTAKTAEKTTAKKKTASTKAKAEKEAEEKK